MSLSEIVNVVITTVNTGVTRAGFGTLGILSANAAWTERVRTYNNLAGVLADFATSTAEYKAAQAVFAQSPAPTQIKILRLNNKPTQKWRVSVVAVQNTSAYAYKVNDVQVSFTSDGTATNDEIIAGLVAAFPVTSGFAAAAVGSAGSQTMEITASAAGGSWCSVEIVDVNKLKIEQVHVDPGVAADLAAIQLEDDDWYGVFNPWNSTAMATAIAAWVEANEKLFLCGTNQTEVITVADGSATDIAKAMKTAAYARTTVWYHPDPSDFLAAALGGRCLPLSPGTETWNLKTLAGVAAVQLTATHRANLKAKFANSYRTVKGRNITFEGRVSVISTFIDYIRYRDELKARIGEDVFGVLASEDKVAYDDDDLVKLKNKVAARLAEGVKKKALRNDPEPTVTFPKVSTMSSGDRADRIYGPATFTASYAGAVHGVNINGQIVF